MTDLEEKSYSELWAMVKELRDSGIDIGDLKYRSSEKEDFINFILDNQDYPEISTIDDVPDEDEDIEEDVSEEDIEEDESEIEEEDELENDDDLSLDEKIAMLPLDEDDLKASNDEDEDVKKEIALGNVSIDGKLLGPDSDPNIPRMKPEKVVAPIVAKPIKKEVVIKKPTPKLVRIVNDANLRSYIGKPVEFKVSWFRGTTECLLDNNFIIKKFQKGVLFRGKLSVRMYTWIKNKRIKIERW